MTSGGPRSPIDSLNTCHPVKVTVPTQEGQGMLAAEGSNPEVINGNRFARSFQFQTNGRVMACGPPVDVKHGHRGNPLPKPVLVLCPVAGLRDPEAILTQYDYRNC